MTTSSRIKWYPPLDAIKGDATELDLAAATPVREVLLRLQAEEPRLQKFFRMKPDSAICSGLIILKGGDILKLDDTIAPGDEVEIMAAIEGG